MNTYEITQQLTQLNNLKVKVETLTTKFENQQALAQTLTQDIESLTNKQQEYANILVATKLILEKITYENKARLESFITNAMQEIFTDKNYAIDIEIREDTKRPNININLVDNGITQDVRDSVGGGIITTIGLLFQIYYLEVYGLNKVIFIDEGLKEVSKTNLNETAVNYLQNLLNFLKALSKERNYKIVIVTHDESVRDIADTVYQVKQGEVIKINK